MSARYTSPALSRQLAEAGLKQNEGRAMSEQCNAVGRPGTLNRGSRCARARAKGRVLCRWHVIRLAKGLPVTTVQHENLAGHPGGCCGACSAGLIERDAFLARAEAAEARVRELETELRKLREENVELRKLLDPTVVWAAKQQKSNWDLHPAGCCGQCSAGLAERDRLRELLRAVGRGDVIVEERPLPKSPEVEP